MNENSGIVGYIDGVETPLKKSELFSRLKRGQIVKIQSGTKTYLNRRRGAALARARKAGNHFQILMEGFNDSLAIHQAIENAREQHEADLAFASDLAFAASVW